MDYKTIINSYSPVVEEEQKDLAYIKEELNKYGEELLYRSCPNHLTASVWIINEDYTKVLLRYHPIYKSFGWLGGHADGEKDLLTVALKEATEESGITSFNVVSNFPISVENLPVKKHIRKGVVVEDHMHLNFTYLLQTRESNKLIEEDGAALKWVNIEDVSKYTKEEIMIPVYEKLNQVVYKLKK